MPYGRFRNFGIFDRLDIIWLCSFGASCGCSDESSDDDGENSINTATIIRHSSNVTVYNACIIESGHQTQMSNYAGQIQVKIGFYEKKDHHFIETRACQQLEKFLLERYWATLLGKSGDGKSATAAHLMLKYKKKGFQPFFVSTVQDWKYYVSGNQTSKQFIVIDDMFGSVYVDDTKVNDWISQAENMLTVVEERKGNLLVVCTCRRVIFKDVEPKLKYFRTQAIVDMTAENCRLCAEEKMKILKNICDKYNIRDCDYEIVKNVDPPHGFPHCAEMFCTNGSLRQKGKSFFDNPFEAVQNEIETLMDVDVKKFLVLLLVLYNDNDLKEESLQRLLLQSTEEEKLLLKTAGVSGAVSLPEIKKAVAALRCVYLKNGPNGGFCFTHESLMEVVAFVHICTAPCYAIEKIQFEQLIGFINNLYQNEYCTKRQMSQSVYNVDENTLTTLLVKRLTKEILSGNVLAACSCNALSDETFVKDWINYIHNDEAVDIISVLSVPDKNGCTNVSDPVPKRLNCQDSELHSFLAFCQWQTADAHYLLDALTYCNRQQAVKAFLGNATIQENMENIPTWKDMLRRGIRIATSICYNVEVVKAYLDVEYAESLDCSEALMIALKLSHTKCAGALLHDGRIRADCTDKLGNGYMHYLVRLNIDKEIFENLCELLLQHGVDLNKINSFGETPMASLKQLPRGNNNLTERLTYMVRKGANL